MTTNARLYSSMLRIVEWYQVIPSNKYYRDDDKRHCLVCHGQLSKGHKPDCELKANLDRLEGK